MSEAEPSSLSAIEPETHALRRKAAVALVCAIGSLGLTPSASLATESLPTVTKAYKTDFNTDRVPVQAWPSGPIIGNLSMGNKISTVMLSKPSGDYIFGLAGNNLCGWVEADTLDSQHITDPAGTCQSYLGLLKDYTKIGKGWNCLQKIKGSDGNWVKCVGGTPGIALKDGCDTTVSGNYGAKEVGSFNNMDPEGDIGFSDPIEKLPPGTLVHYRYTTLDGLAMMVRVDGTATTKGGWFFMHKEGCIDGYPQGGPLKTKDTIPGAHPNSERNISVAETIQGQILTFGVAKLAATALMPFVSRVA